MILGMSCGRDELSVEFMAGISEGWMISVAASSTSKLRSVEMLRRVSHEPVWTRDFGQVGCSITGIQLRIASNALSQSVQSNIRLWLSVRLTRLVPRGE